MHSKLLFPIVVCVGISVAAYTGPTVDANQAQKKSVPECPGHPRCKTIAPSNIDPETDARGIPVISDAAEVPIGANDPAGIAPGSTFVPDPNQAQVFTPRPSTETYPPCSRTVTDNCVQTYERGSGRPG